MKYEIDDETREFLESVLNIVVGVAELQYDDTAKQGLISLAEILADRFDIPTQYVDIDENGNIIQVHGDDLEEPSSGMDANIATTLTEDPDGTVH